MPSLFQVHKSTGQLNNISMMAMASTTIDGSRLTMGVPRYSWPCCGAKCYKNIQFIMLQQEQAPYEINMLFKNTIVGSPVSSAAFSINFVCFKCPSLLTASYSSWLSARSLPEGYI